VNKSQQDTHTELKEPKVKKIFSLKFEIQEMGCLTMEEESPNHAKELEGEPDAAQNSLNIAKNKIQMRGSHIEGGQNRRRERSEQEHRKKHITSSEIFNLMNMNAGASLKKGISSEPEQLQEEQSSNSNNNSSNSNNFLEDRANNHQQHILIDPDLATN
jgi:hypothetical protein